jgi:hypothetical protein
MVYDISLYGHLTIDTVFDDSKDYSFGGIANVWRTLKKIDSDLLINLEPTHYGEAIIYVDKSTSKRYSDALLNLKNFTPNKQPSRINLVAYINELDDKSFIDELTGFNIADVCKGKEVAKESLKNIDLLLIADEDLKNLEDLRKNFSGILLTHSASGSTIYYEENEFETIVNNKYFIENLNVLGAGDMFAAVLIYYLFNNMKKDLSNKNNLFEKIKNFIEKIHIETTQILIDYNKLL